MKQMAVPALALVAAAEPTNSWLGGKADLPDGVAPPGAHLGDYRFLARLDLAEARRAGGPDWLPAQGVLHVFLDDQRWGFADAARVMSAPAAAPLVADAACLECGDYARRRALAYTAFVSTPSLDWLGVDYRRLPVDDEAFEDIFDVAREASLPAPLHQVGGYPHEIQSENLSVLCELMARGLDAMRDPVTPEIEAAAMDWRLLLQVDSDEDLRLNWGDGGLVYVFVREADARAGDFTRTVTTMHTH